MDAPVGLRAPFSYLGPATCGLGLCRGVDTRVKERARVLTC